MNNLQFRDITLVPFAREKDLVIACDSSAGIGDKPYDVVQVDPMIMSAYCLRVPLLELLCFGATPKIVIDTVGNEYQPTGKRMLIGVKQELQKAGLEDLPINGSTEENMLTKTSSLGITVIGERLSHIGLPKVFSGSDLYQLGTPYVGDEVVAHLEEIFSYQEVVALKEHPSVSDMLPVGSKGICYEANLMAEMNQLELILETDDQELLTKSAGPATVVLVATLPRKSDILIKDFPHLKKIGHFR